MLRCAATASAVPRADGNEVEVGGEVGAFVAIEGIDQAGKMTQARALQERVRAAGLGCEVRHYPDYETAIGRLIRSFLGDGPHLDPRTRCMLFAANRWEQDTLMRGLVAGNALVCVDRYTDSNVVYGLSQGLDEGWLRGLEVGLLEPDLTLLVDISPAESRRRKQQERDDYERNARLLDEARSHYVRIARQRRWAIIDGTGAAEAVQARLVAAVAARLGARWPDLARALV